MNTNFTPIWAAEPDYEKFIRKCKDNGVSRIITTIPPKELADIANKNNIDVIAYSAVNVSGDMKKSYIWSLQYMNGDPKTESGRKILDNHKPIWSNMTTELTFSGDRDNFAKNNPQFWTKSQNLISELNPGKRIQLSPGFDEVRSYEANRFQKAYKSSQSQGVQLEFVLPNIDEHGNADIGYEDPIRNAFISEYNQDPINMKNSDLNWLNFRANYYSELVGDIYKKIKNEDPKALVSTTIVAGEENDYVKVLQDWPTWIENQYIDEFYLWFRTNSNIQDVEKQTKYASNIIQNRCPLIVELSCYHPGSFQTKKQIIDAAKAALDNGANCVGVYQSFAITQLTLWPALSEVSKLNEKFK